MGMRLPTYPALLGFLETMERAIPGQWPSMNAMLDDLEAMGAMNAIGLGGALDMNTPDTVAPAFKHALQTLALLFVEQQRNKRMTAPFFQQLQLCLQLRAELSHIEQELNR